MIKRCIKVDSILLPTWILPDSLPDKTFHVIITMRLTKGISSSLCCHAPPWGEAPRWNGKGWSQAWQSLQGPAGAVLQVIAESKEIQGFLQEWSELGSLFFHVHFDTHCCALVVSPILSVIKNHAFSPKCCVSKMLCHFRALILSPRSIENNSILGTWSAQNSKKSNSRIIHLPNNFKE